MHAMAAAAAALLDRFTHERVRDISSCRTRPRVLGRPPPPVSARRGWNLLVSASRFNRSRLTLIESGMLERAPSNVSSVSVKFCKLYVEGGSFDLRLALILCYLCHF